MSPQSDCPAVTDGRAATERSSNETDPPPAVTDWLASELPAWVDSGLIDPEQAAAIRRRHGLSASQPAATSDRSRLVVAVSAIGAALVGAGLLVFLGTNWASIPQFLRTLLLVVAPPAAFAVGWQFITSRARRRVGHALWVLGAILAGPSLVLLNDLYDLAVEPVWLTAGWFAVALLAAEAVDSRPTLAVAIVLSVVTTGLAVEPTDPLVPVAALGVLLVARSGLPAAGDADQIAESYRIGGVAVFTLGVLWLATERLDGYALAVDATGWLLAVAAVVAVGLLAVRSRGHPDRQLLVGWLVAAGVVVGLSTLLATAVPTVSEFGALLAIHALLGGLLGGAIVVGYRSASPRLITAAVVLVFTQLVVVLTTTVADALGGSLALVITGLLLLLLAVGLEGGRRSLLSRL